MVDNWIPHCCTWISIVDVRCDFERINSTMLLEFKDFIFVGDYLSCQSHFDLIIFALLLHRNGCFGDEVSRVLGGGLVPGKLVFYTAFHVRLIVYP